MKSLRAIVHEAVDRAFDEIDAQAKAEETARRSRARPRQPAPSTGVVLDEATRRKAMNALRRLGLI